MGRQISFNKKPASQRNDPIFSKLVLSGENDEEWKSLLQLICKDLEPVLQRILEDQIPGGRYWEPDEVLRFKTASVPLYNIASERDFSNFDRLLRNAPNSNLAFLSSKTMCQVNCTMAQQPNR